MKMNLTDGIETKPELTEIPLFFPSLEVTTAKHTCSSGIWRVSLSDQCLQAASPGSAGAYGPLDETWLRGMASIQSMSTATRQSAANDDDDEEDEEPLKDLTVVTSASIEAPSILNIVALPDTKILQSNAGTAAAASSAGNTAPRLCQLDFSSANEMERIVRVSASPVTGWDKNNAYGTSIPDCKVAVTVVDTTGLVLQIHLNVKDWTPQSKIEVLSVPDLLRQHQHPSTSTQTTFGLTQERVIILTDDDEGIGSSTSSTKIMMATNPLLLAVDFQNQQVMPWSLEAARRPYSASGSTGRWSMWGMFGGGKENEQKQSPVAPDMDPVLSMTAADNDASTVFTFHANGMLLRWHCPWENKSLVPRDVKEIEQVSQNLPHESDWSDEPIRMTSHVYQSHDSTTEDIATHYCVALFLQTRLVVSGNNPSVINDLISGDDGMDDDDYGDFGGSRLIVAAGISFSMGPDSQERETSICHPLHLPAGPSALIGAKFVVDESEEGVPALQAMISKDDATAMLCYDPAVEEQTATATEDGDGINHRLVKMAPRIALEEGSLDYVSRQEQWCLEHLSLQPPPSAQASSFHEIDVWFLQCLFRPIACRGVGHLLPPSARRIESALRDCIPFLDSSGLQNTSQNHDSLAVQVVSAMHDWREYNHRQQEQNNMIYKMSTSQSQKGTVDTSGTSGGTLTARSFYESLQQPTGATESEYLPRDEDMEEDTSTESPSAQQLEHYEQLWRELLIHIWRQEVDDRVPLAYSGDFILRTGSISALDARNQIVSTNLDRVAKRVIVWIEDQGELALRLHIQEQSLLQAFANSASSVLNEGGMKSKAENASRELELLVDSLDHVISEEERENITMMLNNNVDQYTLQVQSIPVTTNLADQVYKLGGSTPSSSTHGGMSIQQRLAATSLCSRRLEHARQLFLGRFLVLCGLRAKESIREAAWLGYLRATSLLVASSQIVPLSMTLTNSTGPSSSHSDDGVYLPPKKRPSFDTSDYSMDSILTPTSVGNVTTAMDAFVISVFRDLKQGDLHQLVDSAMIRMFDIRSCDNAKFPELRFLPTMSSPRAAILEQPKLSLILHAPFVVAPTTFALQEEGATGSPKAIQEDRLQSVAECLLSLSSNYPEDVANSMIDRAFQVLRFDPQDLKEGCRRMEKLRQHVILGMANSKLVDHLFNAVREVLDFYPHSAIELNGEFSREFSSLLSLLFYKSMEAEDWDRALFASLKDPSRRVRLDHLKRLVTNMVDSGALSKLLTMCAAHGEEREQHDFVRGMDLYSIASQALAKASHRDWYTMKADEPELLSDYQGALYALHASREEWRRAAQAMDLRFVNARKAWALDNSSPSSNGLIMDSTKRTRLILDDLVLASTGAHNALCLVKNPESRFIISGESGEVPTSPTAKRMRDSSSAFVDTSERGEEEYRLDRYKDIGDLKTRAFVAMGVQKLWMDGTIDQSLAAKFLAEGEHEGRNVQVLINQLFKAGHYDLGMMLSVHMKDLPGAGRAEGRGIFQEAISSLLCDHLVPLVLTGVIENPRFPPFKPTLAQLHAALDVMNIEPPVPLGRAPRKNEESTEASLRFSAMTLLERITTHYTTAEMPLAKEVAVTFIMEHQASELPQWLASLLAFGNMMRMEAPGLFAKRSQAKGLSPSSQFLGDPSALLDIYTMSGMYHAACDLVCKVLDVEARASKSASRLPEKGQMDFVPYHKIDILYNLVEAMTEEQTVTDIYEESVLAARDRMLEALKQHASLLKLAEHGIQSARVLVHP